MESQLPRAVARIHTSFTSPLSITDSYWIELGRTEASAMALLFRDTPSSAVVHREDEAAEVAKRARTVAQR